MIKRVYIAGLLTPRGTWSRNLAIDHLINMRKMVRAALEALFAGFDPFVPAFDYNFWWVMQEGEFITEPMIKRYSKSWLEVCDAMLLLPGWQESPGTLAEIKRAEQLNIPIFKSLDELENMRRKTMTKNEAMQAFELLQKAFPHGHEEFIPLTMDELRLHSEKNYDYTKGGNPLGNFHRVSAIKKIYPDMDWASPVGVCVGYALKQFDAAMWMLSQGYEGEIEGVDRRLEDIHVYFKIARILLEESRPRLPSVSVGKISPEEHRKAG